MEIETTKGRKYTGISFNAKDGDKVVYGYDHHYNCHSSSFRILPARFIQYLPENKCLIKREDCRGNSRVPINQVFKLIKQKGGDSFAGKKQDSEKF